MYKSEKIKYYSQLLSFPWEMVKMSACGITSAAMAMSFFDKSVTPMKVLKRAGELHEVPTDGENHWLEVEDNGEKFLVPVGRNLSDRFLKSIGKEKLRLARNENVFKVYRPCFTIANGYDHRGSERLFASFGIKAKMMGDKNKPVSLDQVKEVVKDGNLFLMSASKKNNPWKDIFGGGESNHIMLITDIVKLKGKECFYFLDPFNGESEKLVHIQEVDNMSEFEFNGYGTVIYVSLS